MFLRRFRHEIIFVCAGQIIDALVAAIFSHWACVASHYVRVHIHRIHRIWDCDLVLAAEDIKNITAITF